MGEEVVVLDLWSSPFGMRVRIAMAEKGLEYDSRENFNKSLLLLQMNPVLKQVPVLIHKGKPIWRLVWIAQGETQAAKKEFVECFKLLESELGEKRFFGGDSLNIINVALVPFYSWFYTLETCGSFSLVAECPHLVEWAKRCMWRESVAESLPDQYKVYTHLLDLRKKHLAPHYA